MKWLKKIDWKVKMFFSILGGALSVILLLFGISYYYFVSKITAYNERIVMMSFEKTEESLKSMVKNAEYYVNKFSNNMLAWQFSDNIFSSTADKSIAIKEIIDAFDQIMISDANVYGLAIWNGDERCAISTSEKKSKTGDTPITESVAKLMEECRENYPYMSWFSNEDVEIPENTPISSLVNRPVLLGLKALGKSENAEEDSYLLVAIDEKNIQKSYERVVFNGSQAVLVDENQRIISATDKAILGTIYQPDGRNQNIEYALPYYRWRLINMIPKDSYLEEARNIRNVGLILGGAAIFVVVGIYILWARRYTLPIQNLMEQMEMVGKEQLDIKKPEKIGWPELSYLNEEFYATVQKLKNYIQKLQKAEEERAREELLALQYQINPHFLYNSLNSIRWMAMMTNNTKVADSLVILGKIIVPILRNPSFTWKLRDELEFLDNYIKMMKIRFGNEMEYHLECMEGIEEEIFPRFIIQPIMENCFVHGSSPTEIREIYLRIRKNERFAIEVQNTGSFLDEEKVKQVNERILEDARAGSSIGLSNIRKRLTLLYGDKGDVWLESSQEKGVLVYIVF